MELADYWLVLGHFNENSFITSSEGLLVLGGRRKTSKKVCSHLLILCLQVGTATPWLPLWALGRALPWRQVWPSPSALVGQGAPPPAPSWPSSSEAHPLPGHWPSSCQASTPLGPTIAGGGPTHWKENLKFPPKKSKKKAHKVPVSNQATTTRTFGTPGIRGLKQKPMPRGGRCVPQEKGRAMTRSVYPFFIFSACRRRKRQLSTNQTSDHFPFVEEVGQRPSSPQALGPRHD